MTKIIIDSINEYFSGKKLYGDDFNEEQIFRWYKDEEEGYANLGNSDKEKYTYQYSEMNKLYGFSYISKKRHFKNAMGLGSAYGYEFLELIDRIDNLTIVEPSDQLQSEKLGEIIPNYVKPNILGNLNFSDNTFDLIICLGVLHHIPNVSFVLQELDRVLAPGGILILREPIVSMGDWRSARVGLTKNERGIPIGVFDKFVKTNNLKILSRKYCDSPIAYKTFQKLFFTKYNTRLIQLIDKIFSHLLAWNYKYHQTTIFEKLSPKSVYLVLKKPKII